MKELNSKEGMDVWEIFGRPIVSQQGEKPNIIDSRWVFKRKTNDKEEILEKGRFVIPCFKVII